jgi:hypothetical protein
MVNFLEEESHVARDWVHEAVFSLRQSVKLEAWLPPSVTIPDDLSIPFKPVTITETVAPSMGTMSTVGVNDRVRVFCCAGQALPPL